MLVNGRRLVELLVAEHLQSGVPLEQGKTKVIGAAVSHLLAQGKSVCVVSNTNVAVDQSILKVVEESSSFEAGKVLRIGNPSIPAIIEHGLLTVKQAVEVKFAPEVQAIASKLAKMMRSDFKLNGSH